MYRREKRFLCLQKNLLKTCFQTILPGLNLTLAIFAQFMRLTKSAICNSGKISNGWPKNHFSNLQATVKNSISHEVGQFIALFCSQIVEFT